MYRTANAKMISYPEYRVMPLAIQDNDIILCDLGSLRAQLLAQWKRLTAGDLDRAGRSRHDIAALVQSKYGIAAPLVENYLSNIERTLPGLS